MTRSILLAGSLALVATWAAMADAQPPPETRVVTPAAGSEELTEAAIAARRKQAEESGELDDESRKRVLELYRQAEEQLQRWAELGRLATESKALAESLPQRLVSLKQQLAELTDKQPRPASIRPAAEDSSTGGLSESPASDEWEPPLQRLKRELAELEHSRSQLQQELAVRELALSQYKEAQARAEAESAERASRRKEIRLQLPGIPKRIEEVKKQLDTEPPADEPPLLALAKHAELTARRMVAEREAPALQNELARYEAEEAADWLQLEQDLAVQQAALAAKEVELVETSLKAARDREADVAVRVSAEEAIQAHPLLRPHAERNRSLAQETRELASWIAESKAQLKQAEQVLEGVRRQYEQTRKKVEHVGLTPSLGSMLRKQRLELPDVRDRRRSVRSRQQAIDEAQLALFAYDDERGGLSDVEPLIDEIIATLPATTLGTDQLSIRQAAEQVLHRRREYVDTLRANYSVYFDTLVELSSAEQELIQLTQTFAHYVDERVLWIRSSRPLGSEWRLDPTDIAWLTAAPWSAIGRTLVRNMVSKPLPYSCLALVLGLLIRSGIPFRREIALIGVSARRSSFHRFAPTLRVVLLTTWISLPVPVLLGFVAWRLVAAGGDNELVKAFGMGLASVALGFLPIELLRQICRPGGLATNHFDWSPGAVQLLRRNLKFLMFAWVPLSLVNTTLYSSDPTHGADLIERIAFVIESAAVAMFLGRNLRPGSGIFQAYFARNHDGWLDRLRYLWYLIGIAAPLLLGLLAIIGYYYTAQQLSWRLFLSAWMVVSLVVLRALLLRLLRVHRRRLAIRQSRERRMAKAAAPPVAPAGLSAVAATIQQATLHGSTPSDLRVQMEQTHRLLGTAVVALAMIGTWLAWVDVLPALAVLDRWPLWTTTIQHVERVEGSGAPAVTQTREVVEQVTIADVAFAAFAGVLAVLAARNVPGLLEIAILQRLPLESSVRYAITRLASYAIALVGVIVACNAIGWRWQQIQWLATALTFGLAFGLQEMFANFVAGIILLFERPIRVGDVVTVDGTTGVVSRIRIRATTITNWDRKELIVPNKEFITGRLLNWTLTDQVNRVVVNVGIAYGSDTQKTREILLRVARAHPLILSDPPPMATLEGFGGSTLDFRLRAFLPAMEHRLSVIHDLHMAIEQAFREEGIEIAFPQREITIKSLPKGLKQRAEFDYDADDRRAAA